MEFRQIVHGVRRSAAAATRPSLASTRPSPSAILFQHHQFTTNTKQQQEAAAVAVQPQSPPPLHARIDQVRTSIPQPKVTMPPRPPPFRRSPFFQDRGKNAPGWVSPTKQPSTRGTTLTGRAPTATSTSAEADPYDLQSQITADMERSTGSMTTWKEDEFLSKHYDVSEPELRLRPSTGRTVHVKGHVDLARGFRLLQRAVAQNGVKRDVHLAKAHERPALKRKRLRRERWQARFKNGFKATISRVMELKAQGW
jgi:small subunit ribosomal protein MRP21